MFWSRIQKDTKEGGKRVFFFIFLDPNSPRLAFGSPGPWNYLLAKQPARLGELKPSQGDYFPINRHDGGCFKGLGGSALKGIERIEIKEEEKEKEERRKKRKWIQDITESWPRLVLVSLFVLCFLCSSWLVCVLVLFSVLVFCLMCVLFQFSH